MRTFPLICAALLAPALTGADWPQWRGPEADGSAPGANPPVRWDGTRNVGWKAAVPGKGSSTPIVWGDKVFLLTAVDTGRRAAPADLPKPPADRFKKKTTPPGTWHRFLVLCFDLKTGKELWRRTAAERVPHEGHHPTHSYAAGSPATDGKRLVASFGSYGVFAYDLGGKPLWSRDLGRMETRLGWGEASTPVLHGDRVVVNWDHEGASFITALDADTGKTVWREARDEVTSWATPLVTTYRGVTQVIVPATNRARSYDLATGKVLWECGGFTVNCIPSPVRYRDRVILMSGYRGAMAKAVPLDSRGDVTDRPAWSHARGTPYVPSPSLAGDRLYFTSGNEPLLSCLDCRTGAVLLDRVRVHGLRNLYASPVVAGGRVYLVDREGTTAVLEHGEALRVLAVNKLGEPVDASPAVVGARLLLRGERHLYCLKERPIKGDAPKAPHTKDGLQTVKKAVAERKAILVDVREKDEWDEGHLRDAVLLPLSELQGALDAQKVAGVLGKDKVVYLHCRSGRRCLTAAEILRKRGYDARPLKAGYEELRKAGFPRADR